MRYTIQNIADMTQGSLRGNKDLTQTFDTLLTDSRSLSLPESTIFFALKTRRGNGDAYIAQLYRAGVRAFVCTDTYKATPSMPDAAFIIVDDPLEALQKVAASHRAAHNEVATIAITGSNGKTIVKEWLYQLLGDKQKTIRSPRSYNSQVGVPLSVTLITDDTRLALIEAGISMPGEMERLNHMIQPDTVVITNIGEAHQENFATMRQKALEKLKLSQGADKVIYPADDETLGDAVAEARIEPSRLYRWSLRDTGAFLHIESITNHGDHTEVSCHTHDGRE